MSHFTVLVIAKSEEEIDELLAPYDENLEVPKYRSYLKPAKTLRDGRLSYPWGAALEQGVDISDLSAMLAFLNDGVDIDSEWAEFEMHHLDDEGIYQFSTYNPMSKWDWWSLGGRWRGLLHLKEGCSGEIGEAGVFGGEVEELRVSMARKGDVDLVGMHRAGVASFVKEWEEYEAELSSGDPKRARLLYQGSATTREEAIAEAEANAGVYTYALLTSEGWFSRGDMGWFGVSTDKEGDDYAHLYRNVLRMCPDDYVLAVVDCHI